MQHHDAHEQLNDPKYAYLWHSKANDYLGAGKRRAGRPKKSQAIVDDAFHEVFSDEPSTVTRAKVSGKRKQKMKVAIALSKARKAGARIPRR